MCKIIDVCHLCLIFFIIGSKFSLAKTIPIKAPKETTEEVEVKDESIGSEYEDTENETFNEEFNEEFDSGGAEGDEDSGDEAQSSDDEEEVLVYPARNMPKTGSRENFVPSKKPGNKIPDNPTEDVKTLKKKLLEKSINTPSTKPNVSKEPTKVKAQVPKSYVRDVFNIPAPESRSVSKKTKRSPKPEPTTEPTTEPTEEDEEDEEDITVEVTEKPQTKTKKTSKTTSNVKNTENQDQDSVTKQNKKVPKKKIEAKRIKAEVDVEEEEQEENSPVYLESKHPKAPIVVDSKTGKIYGNRHLTSSELKDIFYQHPTNYIDTKHCGPKLKIKARCASHIAFVNFSNQEDAMTKIKLKQENGRIVFDGPQKNAYIIWDSNGVPNIQTFLSPSDLYNSCKDCSNYEVDLIIKGSNVTDCEANIKCPHIPNKNVLLMYKRLSFSDGTHKAENLPPIRTTMQLYKDKERQSLVGTEMIILGTEIYLSIESFSSGQPLDIRLQNCAASDSNSVSVTILKGGCGTTSVLSSLEENVSWKDFRGTRNELITYMAKLNVFNLQKYSQNITITCDIKICGMECQDKVPPCVISNINERKEERLISSLFEEIVTLKVTYLASGVEVPPKTDQAAEYQNKFYSEANGECIPKTTFFITIFSIICIFTLLLVFGWLCTRKAVSLKNYRNTIDEIESPPRTFYPDFASVRKRSPNTSDEYLDMSNAL